jgi:hypothetical protein
MVKIVPSAKDGYFYWDDLPTGRLRPEIVCRQQVLEQAQVFARA